MCGRFTLKPGPADLAAVFPGVAASEALPPRYNIAPTQDVAVVRNDGRMAVEFFRWGLVPRWARDVKVGNSMINARSETLAVKPAFREAYRARRCLVLADGFYEWKKGPARTVKEPYYIRLKSGLPFAFAGLWEAWRGGGDAWGEDGADTLYTCTIITVPSNELVASIHDRMPAILGPDAWREWIAPEPATAGRLARTLVPFPPGLMSACPVSPAVNKPGYDSPGCVEPVGPCLG